MNEKFASLDVSNEKPSILDNQEKLFNLARKLGNVYENRPDIDSFVGAMRGTKYGNDYSKESIDKDKLYIKKTREKIDEKNSSFGRDALDRNEGGFQLSEILQAMIVDRLNKKWFKEISTIMTSDYDDLHVGMDAIMKRQKGYLGVSFDFTVTNKDTKIYDKLKKEWANNIAGGKIPVVKYFTDYDTKEKGRLLVPKFIIGASKKDVEELANAYLTDNTEVLENHPLKYVILLQIEEQLQTALDYYETNSGNEKFKFAKQQYENIQKILRGMKQEVHADEKMHENTDLHEYVKSNVALDMIRRFRIMREKDLK